MLLSTDILDNLTLEARASELLRKNLDLRTTSADQSQRMLNALEPGTRVPIHRHPDTSETVVVLRGSVKEIFFDEQGNQTESFTLRADAEPKAMSIPAGIWHTAQSLQPGTIILEAKDGPFRPRKHEDIMEHPGRN